MEVWRIIFKDSFGSALVPVRAELGWFAALAFGEQSMRDLSLVAIMAVMLAVSLLWLIGGFLYSLGLHRSLVNEERYNKFKSYADRFVWVMVICLPPFLQLGALAGGFFRVSLKKMLIAVCIGRVAYYAIYSLGGLNG